MSGHEPSAKSRIGRLIEVPSDAPLAERVKALEQESQKLHLLLEMSALFSTVKELDALMALLVQHTTRIMNCERSSVLLLDKTKSELYALVAQGLDVKELRFSVNSGIAGYVAREGVMLNIPDAYQDPRFNPEPDKASGFRTVSVLCAPMSDGHGHTLGVIQCLNKKGGQGEAAVFNREDELLLPAVASHAAFYLENTSLHHQMDKLFEAFVEATSRSIDDRDPCTSGHSRRVMRYALNLARAVHDSRADPFARLNYTRDRMRQLRYAALLHDVGKIGVRECVLSKASKLSPQQLEVIRHRLAALREKSRADILAECLARKLDPAALQLGADVMLSQRHQPLCGEIEMALKLIEGANSSNFMRDEEIRLLQLLRERGLITDFEFTNLVVRRGNLTDTEWVDMRSHVTKSFRLLQEIPWPAELKDLPEVAFEHHEKRDGSGYPRKLKSDEIHFDSQILCVADIYDALTAADRPYKKAIPFEKAREILLAEEAGRGKILPELVKLFFDTNCYTLTHTPMP